MREPAQRAPPSYFPVLSQVGCWEGLFGPPLLWDSDIIAIEHKHYYYYCTLQAHLLHTSMQWGSLVFPEKVRRTIRELHPKSALLERLLSELRGEIGLGWDLSERRENATNKHPDHL